jgi:hypothetical protein
MLEVVQAGGSQRNVTLNVRGLLTKEMPMTPISVKLEQVKGLKLASLVWAIQEKLGLYLWWDEETILLPLESRNSMRFDVGVPSPDGWNGTLYLSSYGFTLPPAAVQKAFFLVLDFDR